MYSSEDWYIVVIKGWYAMLWCLNEAQLVKKKNPSQHYTTSSSLNYCCEAAWIHAFMVFTLNSEPTSQLLEQTPRLVRPGDVSSVFYCPVLVSLCQLQPLSCSELIRVPLGEVLCSCSSVLCVHRCSFACLPCKEWLFEWVECIAFPWSSLSVHKENCHSLNIFSFWILLCKPYKKKL